MQRLRFTTYVTLLAVLAWLPSVTCAEEETGSARLEVSELLVIPRLARGGRVAFSRDPLMHRVITGTWSTPEAGTPFDASQADSPRWERIKANEAGIFNHKALRGGYAVASVTAPSAGVYLLQARGHRFVFVNGVSRGGDVYDAGITKTAVELRQGPNELIMKGGRGRLRLHLEPVTKHPRVFGGLHVSTKDLTLPSLRRGEAGAYQFSIVVSNTSTSWRDPQPMDVEGLTGCTGRGRVDVPMLAPLATIRANGFIRVESMSADAKHATIAVSYPSNNDVVRAAEIKLPIHAGTGHHKRTFLSGIDNSVQLFGVSPAAPGASGAPRPGLVMSCHGAGVNALGQARAYAAKDWCHVVAPTNRRKFGFDWEDWGRLDFFEVKREAERLFRPDPQQVHITGHSMGGHGTWIIGSQFPDQFGAVAPSAGWRDFWSYGGLGLPDVKTRVQGVLDRASNVSRTLLLRDNLRHGGVYVLHGDADDNVPVTQARFMRTQLAEFHPNFVYYEQPGAGHWWGNKCVDWPALFAFLKQNPVPPASTCVSPISFTTVNPAVSHGNQWINIGSQLRSLEPSRVDARISAAESGRHIEISTKNVADLWLTLRTPWRQLHDGWRTDPRGTPWKSGESVLIRIDGESVRATIPEDGMLMLRHPPVLGGGWEVATEAPLDVKTPIRAGPFKEAFRRGFVMVVGTQGTPEENAAALEAARFHADTWKYRGNGRGLIVRDTAFLQLDASDRNVILYGHREMNAAWSKVLPTSCPIDITRGSLRVADRKRTGEDHVGLFVYPRQGSASALVGVIAGTGNPGMRTALRMPIFLSGAGFPDWLIVTPQVLQDPQAGPQGAGFFNRKWQLEPNSAWEE